MIINLPKMKTHGQVGVTLNVKNFIGCVGNKNCLPHYRIGDSHEGGDEFPSLTAGARLSLHADQLLKDLLLSDSSRYKTRAYRRIRRQLAKVKRGLKKMYILLRSQHAGADASGAQKKTVPESGYWFGNDTLWRTVLDIFHIMECGREDGTLSDVPCRRLYGIIDGIVAGDHNGPNANETRNCGVLISGSDLIANDLAAIRLMGFDYRKIPLYRNLTGSIPDCDAWIQSIGVKSEAYSDIFSNPENCFFDFREPDGWKGKLKL